MIRGLTPTCDLWCVTPTCGRGRRALDVATPCSASLPGSHLSRRPDRTPYDHGRGGPGDWWILTEPELHLARDVLVPDLGGWRRERMPRLPAVAYFPLAPDWICEVISPSTARLDRTKKLRIYAREGVRHAWIVDPLARTLEVLRLEGTHWTIAGTHAGSDVVRAEPFDAVDLELPLLWDEPARSRTGA